MMKFTDFRAKTLDEKWVADKIYISTDEGWLYLTSVEVLFTRKVVGQALDSRMTKQLTLEQSIKRERPSEELIFYSDRGSQYATYSYQDKLEACGIRQTI